MSDSHTKFVWISSNGLGGHSITAGRTHGQTDRSDYTMYLLLFCFCFQKGVWINIKCLLNFFPNYILYLLLEHFVAQKECGKMVHAMRHFITGNSSLYID